MKVELQRRVYGTDPDSERCYLCNRDYEVGSIYIQPIAGSGWVEASMCPGCLAILQHRRDASDRAAEWPTLADYQEACRRYPEPIFSTQEEINRAERDDSLGLIWDASWLGSRLTA